MNLCAKRLLEILTLSTHTELSVRCHGETVEKQGDRGVAWNPALVRHDGSWHQNMLGQWLDKQNRVRPGVFQGGVLADDKGFRFTEPSKPKRRRYYVILRNGTADAVGGEPWTNTQGLIIKKEAGNEKRHPVRQVCGISLGINFSTFVCPWILTVCNLLFSSLCGLR